MDKILYIDGSSGISGDMSVAMLLDLGASWDYLQETIASLPVEEKFSIEKEQVSKSGIACCSFRVELEQPTRDDDMEYLHGRTEHKRTELEKAIKQEKGNSKHSHPRGPKEILDIFLGSNMTKAAKELAIKILMILAKAEGKVHQKPIEEVHFHEVGSLDSIVDIAAFAICYDNLGIQKVYVEHLWEGCGSIYAQHGWLPIPVPATTEIIKEYQIPVHFSKVEGELITPTGAAIVAAVATFEKAPNQVQLVATGNGAGKRAYDTPGFCRGFLVQGKKEDQENICKIETNVDDCTGEVLGYVMEQLFLEGAKDVSFIPVTMKKQRPGVQIQVICDSAQREKMIEILFRETTTIGVRYCEMMRETMMRKQISFESSLGSAKIKECTWKEIKKGYPEYESMCEMKKECKLPLMEVYETVQAEWKERH